MSTDEKMCSGYANWSHVAGLRRRHGCDPRQGAYFGRRRPVAPNPPQGRPVHDWMALLPFSAIRLSVGPPPPPGGPTSDISVGRTTHHEGRKVQKILRYTAASGRNPRESMTSEISTHPKVAKFRDFSNQLARKTPRLANRSAPIGCAWSPARQVGSEGDLVPVIGLEPTTPSLRMTCSTS